MYVMNVKCSSLFPYTKAVIFGRLECVGEVLYFAFSKFSLQRFHCLGRKL